MTLLQLGNTKEQKENGTRELGTLASHRKKPDHLAGLATSRLLEALGNCRQAVISAMTQVKPAGPVYHGCQMVTSAIDALAHLITGSPHYFHAQGTLAEPGEPNWSRDRSASQESQ